MYHLAGAIMRLHIKAALLLHSSYRLHTLYLLAGAIMRLHIKATLAYTVYTGYISCTSLLVQLCLNTSKPHFLTQCIQGTYAVPPCWCNYAFTHQSSTSLHSVHRLHTLYLLAGAIMRLHIKATLAYTVHTGYIRCTSLLVQSCLYTSKPHLLTQCIQATYAVPPCWCNCAFTHQNRISLHSLYRLYTLYLLAGAIMRLHIKATLAYTVYTGYIRCTSLLVQSCIYTSKPHLLTQCIQATYAVPPCWCNCAFTHQNRISLHSVYRLYTLYLLAGAIMHLHIKATLAYTVYTGYIRCTSLLVQSCVYTSKPHLLTQCIQATYAVPPCWCNYAFTHQSRISLYSVYMLHTLYLLAGAIMRLHIKAAFPYTVYTGYIRCTSLLVQLCVYTSKPHFLIQTTYAVPPCWCNYSFTHESCTSSPVLKIIDVFCLAMYFRFRSHAKPAGGETWTKGDT